MEQLVLGALRRKDAIVFDTYIPEQNQEVVDCLKNILPDTHDRFIYIWGMTGAGKTHLTQACCAHASKQGFSAMYIALGELSSIEPHIFESMETYDLVCIDDLDAIAGQAVWEEAIFHFFNRFKENAGKLVVSASHAPREIKIQLPDLKSRLQGGLCFHLQALSDIGKQQVLVLAAKARGFHLSASVLDYLLHHFSRNMSDLFTLLDRLDDASLVEGKKLTVPFVKKTLGSYLS